MVHHEILIRIDQRLLQVCDQLRHILVSAVRGLLTALQYDVCHTGRDLRYIFLGRRHFLLNMLDGDRYCGLPVKGYSASQHLEHRNSQRINIALLIAVATSGLLRRSIVDTSHDIGGNGVTGSCLGDTEVRHLYLTVFGDNDILRFDIPMNNMIIMRSLNSHAYLDSNTYRFLVRQTRLFFNVFFEGDAFYQLHYDIVDSVLFSYIIDIYDIGMHQSRCRLCLNAEFRDKISVLTKFLFQYLDRHIAIQLMTFCFIDI